MTTTFLLYWRSQMRQAGNHRIRWSPAMKPPSMVRRWSHIARQQLGRRAPP